MKRLTLHCLASSLHRFITVNTIYINCRNCIKTGQNFWQHICQGKNDYVFQVCYEKYEHNEFLGKLPMESIASSLLCVNIFFVKALRQWWQIREAMKRWNVDYGKKLKQWSHEAFNAGIEIEAMKRLTLHRIASSLLLPSFACGLAQLACWRQLIQHNNTTANVQ
jgi:hypothetical protein